jgi:hypothetical protein
MNESTRSDVYAAKEKSVREKQFIDVDRRILAQMPDKDLAAWQAKFPSDSPQFILAQYEWQRRITADQIKTMRFAAWLGVMGAIFGAVAGSIVTLYVQSLSQ